VTVVTDTLNQLPGLAKPQRKFIAALLATILALRGRVNYRNLARYGDYSERTYSRQFQRPFPWLEYHAKTIRSALPEAHELIAAQDASFIPKSGKKTYGLGKFYNGCASRAAVAAHTGDEPFVFSLATQKQLAFNEHFMAEISTKLGYVLSCWKNHPAYEELRAYGALAT
jgi:hypothetical protein